MSKPWKNHEGYSDPTAYAAMKNVEMNIEKKEQKTPVGCSLEMKADKIEVVKAYPHFLLCRAHYGDRSYNFCINKADFITGEIRLK